MNGQFAQILTVHRDVGLFQTRDQTAVGNAEGTAGGVETHDPKLAERRLVLAAVAISELLRALNGLEGVDVQTGFVSEVALSGFDRALLSGLGGRACRILKRA